MSLIKGNERAGTLPAVHVPVNTCLGIADCHWPEVVAVGMNSTIGFFGCNPYTPLKIPL